MLVQCCDNVITMLAQCCDNVGNILFQIIDWLELSLLVFNPVGGEQNWELKQKSSVSAAASKLEATGPEMS